LLNDQRSMTTDSPAMPLSSAAERRRARTPPNLPRRLRIGAGRVRVTDVGGEEFEEATLGRRSSDADEAGTLARDAMATRNSFGCPFNCRQSACAVNDAHNLRAVFGNAVERKPTLDDDRPRFRLDFGAGSAKTRMVVEQPARPLNAVIDAIGDRFRIVRGDIKPDIEQVLACAGCKSNPGHALRFVAAKRARASFFKAMKSTAPASPLSMPSFQAWRSKASFSASCCSVFSIRRSASRTTSLDEP
jgi:hypothetical protein